MRGPEYARTLLRASLEEQVPGRLAVIRAELEDTYPPDPRSVLLADVLPDDPSMYPVILVQSPTMAPPRPSSAGLANGVFEVEYEMRIVVAVPLDEFLGMVAASIGRDRMLRAVTEAVLWKRQLTDDCQLVTGAMTAETGQAALDLQGRPIALGTLTLAVRTYEELTDPIGPVETSSVTVTPINE